MRPLLRTPLSAVAAILLVAVAPAARAHDGVVARLAQLDEQLERRPDDVPARLARAGAHRARRDFRAAREDLDAARGALAGRPSEALDEAYARLWLDARAPDLAWAALARAAERPDAPAGRCVLAADVLAALGRHADALAQLDRALALEAATPDLALRRARLCEATFGADGPARALDSLAPVLAGARAPVALELEALRLEERCGRTDAALARVTRLLEHAPRPAALLARRAAIARAAGDRERAHADAAAALRSLRALSPTARGATETLRLERELRALLASLAPTSSLPTPDCSDDAPQSDLPPPAARER